MSITVRNLTKPRAPRSQTPVWERPSAKLLFRGAVGTPTRCAKRSFAGARSQTEFGNEEYTHHEAKAFRPQAN